MNVIIEVQENNTMHENLKPFKYEQNVTNTRHLTKHVKMTREQLKPFKWANCYSEFSQSGTLKCLNKFDIV